MTFIRDLFLDFEQNGTYTVNNELIQFTVKENNEVLKLELKLLSVFFKLCITIPEGESDCF